MKWLSLGEFKIGVRKPKHKAFDKRKEDRIVRPAVVIRCDSTNLFQLLTIKVHKGNSTPRLT